ncbi:unnamed protein product, partial [Oikopleura dioica]
QNAHLYGDPCVDIHVYLAFVINSLKISGSPIFCKFDFSFFPPNVSPLNYHHEADFIKSFVKLLHQYLSYLGSYHRGLALLIRPGVDCPEIITMRKSARTLHASYLKLQVAPCGRPIALAFKSEESS